MPLLPGYLCHLVLSPASIFNPGPEMQIIVFWTQHSTFKLTLSFPWKQDPGSTFQSRPHVDPVTQSPALFLAYQTLLQLEFTYMPPVPNPIITVFSPLWKHVFVPPNVQSFSLRQVYKLDFGGLQACSHWSQIDWAGKVRRVERMKKRQLAEEDREIHFFLLQGNKGSTQMEDTIILLALHH